MSSKFIEVLLLVSLGLVFHGECAPTKVQKQLTIRTIDCSILNGTKPVDIINSKYTLLPNGTLCCPLERYSQHRDYCTSKAVMKDICGDRGIVYEPCFHCKTCAKSIGETCSGPQYTHGHCGKDLLCIGEGGTNLVNEDMVGACTNSGGRPTKQPGQICGGRFDSVGVCEPESTCVKEDHKVLGECVKHGEELL